jgi:hypothetical protein
MSLISLCASHLNSIERFKHFEEMLTSWNNQKIKLPLFVSISTLDDYMFVLNKKKLNGKNYTII